MRFFIQLFTLILCGISISCCTSLDFVENTSRGAGRDSDVLLDIQGTINGQTEWLASSDIIGGVREGEQAGYPVYRGLSLSATPGTTITNISVDLFASCIDCDGELEIGVAFDTPTPNSYERFSFGMGDSYHKTLPSITVPNGTRRMVYIRIFDVN